MFIVVDSRAEIYAINIAADSVQLLHVHVMVEE